MTCRNYNSDYQFDLSYKKMNRIGEYHNKQKVKSVLLHEEYFDDIGIYGSDPIPDEINNSNAFAFETKRSIF